MSALTTRVDEWLDLVRARERELTVDIRDATPERVQEWTRLAHARGLHVAGSRNWLLIRDLRGGGE